MHFKDYAIESTGNVVKTVGFTQQFLGHQKLVFGLKVHHDILYTASLDTTMRSWDVHVWLFRQLES
jgi:hypothetical protein